MARTRLVHHETPMEFFRDQLEQALHHQRVATSAFTQYYLVDLLTSAVRVDRIAPREQGYDATPLALLYVRAYQAARLERARLLRMLGDSALLTTGFFAESVERSSVNLGYYRSLGGRAYARLSHEGESRGFGHKVFSELSRRFMEFADVLHEVSETSLLSSPRSLVRLYERWLQTRSRRAAELLAARGIALQEPVEGPVH